MPFTILLFVQIAWVKGISFIFFQVEQQKVWHSFGPTSAALSKTRTFTLEQLSWFSKANAATLPTLLLRLILVLCPTYLLRIATSVSTFTLPTSQWCYTLIHRDTLKVSTVMLPAVGIS